MSGLVHVDEPGDDGVALVELTRAEKKNALSIALREEMSDALDELARDERCRALVITGRGDVFSAGFDLDEFADESAAERLWTSSDRWHHTVLEFPVPSIAAVNGGAYGGGFDLAVMCDLRIAAATARFGHPEHAFTEVIYAPLHDLVGGAVARDLALTGRRIDADEALTLGVVNRVVAPEDLRDAALGTAREIAVAPRDVVLRMKAKMLRRSAIAFDQTLEL